MTRKDYFRTKESTSRRTVRRGQRLRGSASGPLGDEDDQAASVKLQRLVSLFSHMGKPAASQELTGRKRAPDCPHNLFLSSCIAHISKSHFHLMAVLFCTEAKITVYSAPKTTFLIPVNPFPMLCTHINMLDQSLAVHLTPVTHWCSTLLCWEHCLNPGEGYCTVTGSLVSQVFCLWWSKVAVPFRT